MRGKRRMHKTAAQHETAACLQWLEHEIALVAPKVVIALGATAARALLGRTISIPTKRGQAGRSEAKRGQHSLQPPSPARQVVMPVQERDGANVLIVCRARCMHRPGHSQR